MLKNFPPSIPRPPEGSSFRKKLFGVLLSANLLTACDESDERSNSKPNPTSSDSYESLTHGMSDSETSDSTGEPMDSEAEAGETSGADSSTSEPSSSESEEVISEGHDDSESTTSTTEPEETTEGVDNIPPEEPVITTNNGQPKGIFESTFELKGTCSNDAFLVEYNIDGSEQWNSIPYSTGSQNWSTEITMTKADGVAHTFCVRVKDKAGNYSSEACIDVTRFE